MATLNFPDDPSSGDKYTDSNSGFTYEWDGTVWKSSDPSTAANIREIDDISSDFDGSDTTFTLKVAGVNIEPANVQQLIISVGGVMQNAGDDFTVSGSTLTFTTAPTSGLTFFGTYLGTALSLNIVADGSVGSSSLKTEDFTIGGSGNTVTIPGNLTVQGTETIINVDELNIQDKTIGIASTNAPTATTQDGAGAIIYGQTHIDILYDVDKAALGISTAVNVAGFVTATGALKAGTGSTITGVLYAESFSGALASWTLGASGTDHYTFDGPGLTGAESDPTIYLQRGKRYNFVNASGGHPFRIQSDPNGSTGTAYNDGITNNDAGNGTTLEWDVQFDAPNVLYYQCTSHANMGGKIYIGNSGDSAIIGTGVTINNTGIDLGIGGVGVVTTKNVTGAAATISSSFIVGNSASVPIQATEFRTQFSGTDFATSSQGQFRYQDNASGPTLTFAHSRNGSLSGQTILQDGDEFGKIRFYGSDGVDFANYGAEIRAKVDGTPGADDMPGRLEFYTTADGGTVATERLRITRTGGFQFSNGLFDEKCNITAGKLSDNQNIDLENGMVHYFSTQESTTATPNIRINSSTTLQTAMDTGDVCSVTLITTAAAGGYSANLTIDGNAVTEEWVGGSAPDSGSDDGLDIYTYTIICIGTGTGDSGFKVIANLTNATN